MAKFVEGNELNFELEKIFEEASLYLILVSPYIKLHERFKYTLKTKINEPELEIVIIFGKNEDDLSKSISQEDLDFFMGFPNIQIFYEKRLHAKFYGNEHTAMLTSMNLYSYSQNNNIEAGILMKSSDKGIFGNKTDLGQQAWDYFDHVIEQAEMIFDNEPTFVKKGIFDSKKYDGSKNKLNKIPELFGSKTTSKESEKKPISTDKIEDNMGFCIRTGKRIAFNLEKPLDYESFKIWNLFGDPNYPEKFCHFSGEESKGETSFNRPILHKYWNEAKSKFGF